MLRRDSTHQRACDKLPPLYRSQELALHDLPDILVGHLAFEPGNAPIDVFAAPKAEFVIGSALRHPSPLVLGSYSVHSSSLRLQQGIEGIERVAQRLRSQDNMVKYP